MAAMNKNWVVKTAATIYLFNLPVVIDPTLLSKSWPSLVMVVKVVA